jgi:predicted porin
MVNTTSAQTYVAATYDFGILKAYANYINRKDTNNFNSSEFLKRTGQQIGVRSYITPTIEAWAQGGLGKTTAFGSSNPAANLTSWQVGSNYWLSKRTNLYALYGQSATSNSAVATTGTTAVMSSYNQNNYAVGVKHTF